MLRFLTLVFILVVAFIGTADIFYTFGKVSTEWRIAGTCHSSNPIVTLRDRQYRCELIADTIPE